MNYFPLKFIHGICQREKNRFRVFRKSLETEQVEFSGFRISLSGYWLGKSVEKKMCRALPP
jgi:hypothetical protein